MTPEQARAKADAYLDAMAKRDPVPCNGCAACCRDGQAVEVREEWGDDMSRWNATNCNLENMGNRWGMTLKRREDGSCTFLIMGACSIYENRPKVCKAFDCRRAIAGYGGNMKKAVKKGVFSQEIWDAAQARMDTLKLTEEEAGLWTAVAARQQDRLAQSEKAREARIARGDPAHPPLPWESHK